MPNGDKNGSMRSHAQTALMSMAGTVLITFVLFYGRMPSREDVDRQITLRQEALIAQLKAVTDSSNRLTATLDNAMNRLSSMESTQSGLNAKLDSVIRQLESIRQVEKRP